MVRYLVCVCMAVMVTLSGCMRSGTPDEAIRLGAGSTVEQQVLVAITAEMLGRNDFITEIVPELGDSADVRDAALAGRADLYWDYSGAAWTLSLGLSAPPVDAQESFEAVAAEEQENGLLWLQPTVVDARLAFFVMPDEVPPDTDATLSWLASLLPQVDRPLCADADYLEAPSGYGYLAETYAIAEQSVQTNPLAPDDALQGVAEGSCVAGLAPQGSGRSASLGLRPLADDLGVFPAQVLAPVVVVDGRGDVPPVRETLAQIATLLSVEVMADLNAAVAAGDPPDTVARDFLDPPTSEGE